MLQQTEPTKTKQKSKKEPVRHVDELVKNLAIEHHAIVQLLITLYKNAYKVEQAYSDECASDPVFRTEYPLFRDYIKNKIPLFDILDYYSFKPLIVIDEFGALDCLDNGAFRVLRTKLVKLSTGVIHQATKSVLEDLPRDRTVTEIDVRSILNKHSIMPRQVKAGKNIPLSKRGFTDAQLKKMTKNDLFLLCKKLQKKLIKLESR